MSEYRAAAPLASCRGLGAGCPAAGCANSGIAAAATAQIATRTRQTGASWPTRTSGDASEPGSPHATQQARTCVPRRCGPEARRREVVGTVVDDQSHSEDRLTARRMTGRGRLRAPYVVGALLVVVALAGAWLLFVRGGGSTTQSTPQGTGASSVRHVAQPAGSSPSESARMVCAPEAQKDLASAL